MNAAHGNNRLSLVFTPEHLGEALSLYARNPGAILYAGGTALLSKQSERLPIFGAPLISLKRVEELGTFRRYENFIEFGAAVTLGDILRCKESRFLPPVFKTAVRAVGTPAVRNTATIGGHLAVTERKLLLLPILLILDAAVEVKSQTATRSGEIKRFLDEKNGFILQANEIITKIRIPTGRFNLWGFSALPGSVIRSQDFFMSCFVARKNRFLIEKINFAFNIDGRLVIRIKQSEDRLIGKKFPLSAAEIREEMRFFTSKIEGELIAPSPYKKERIINAFRLILTQDLTKSGLIE